MKVYLNELTPEQKNTPEYKQVIDYLTKKGWLPDEWDLCDFCVYINDDGSFKKTDLGYVIVDLIY